MSMSRGGSRRGTERGNEGTQPSGDGWAVAGTGSGPPRPPPKVGDLSNFGKIAKSTPMTFGPSGVFAGKKDTKKETLSRSNSSSNMFSMLSQNPEGAGGGAGDAAASSKHDNRLPRKTSVDISQGASEPPAQRKKLTLLPRSKPLEEAASSTVTPPPASENGSENEGPDALIAEPSMTEEEALKKIAEDTKEFFAVRNLDEAEEYFGALSAEHQFRLVDKLVTTAIESKEADAQLVAEFFSRAVEKELCGGASFEEGFMPTADLLDEIVFDAPKAFELMALMMKGAELDKDEERRTRIAGKSKDSDKLLALLLA
jgi:translation initiation factor 4G